LKCKDAGHGLGESARFPRRPREEKRPQRLSNGSLTTSPGTAVTPSRILRWAGFWAVPENYGHRRGQAHVRITEWLTFSLPAERFADYARSGGRQGSLVEDRAGAKVFIDGRLGCGTAAIAALFRRSFHGGRSVYRLTSRRHPEPKDQILHAPMAISARARAGFACLHASAHPRQSIALARRFSQPSPTPRGKRDSPTAAGARASRASRDFVALRNVTSLLPCSLRSGPPDMRLWGLRAPHRERAMLGAYALGQHACWKKTECRLAFVTGLYVELHEPLPGFVRNLVLPTRTPDGRSEKAGSREGENLGRTSSHPRVHTQAPDLRAIRGREERRTEGVGAYSDCVILFERFSPKSPRASSHRTASSSAIMPSAAAPISGSLVGIDLAAPAFGPQLGS